MFRVRHLVPTIISLQRLFAQLGIPSETFSQFTCILPQSSSCLHPIRTRRHLYISVLVDRVANVAWALRSLYSDSDKGHLPLHDKFEMRFLCLHGIGMNAQIFRSQMSQICSALGSDNSFVFLNGSVATKPLPGLEGQYGGPYLRFGPNEGGDFSAVPDLIEDLLDQAAAEGPFDGIIGFSEGGAVAANMMIMDGQDDPPWCNFKCGIFFCALTPVDMTSIAREMRSLSQAQDGILLKVPTAHIWAEGGDQYPDMGRELVDLCDGGLREEVIHSLGHEIPGSRSDEFLRDTVRAIERTIERAKALS
ncbi:serine hydrolase-domain-containing protein [Stachybotrys elegans]|uniref:Serine hydrolase-domain-containing protein n=1 Tax=Stachybotrys elegans TaxID=80388 RepID=A0A8K0SL60_9HYPO|nr:serine hydrolase-domain-containing protein [Stachybotrys elegans]